MCTFEVQGSAFLRELVMLLYEAAGRITINVGIDQVTAEERFFASAATAFIPHLFRGAKFQHGHRIRSEAGG